MIAHLTDRSRNVKTGPIPVSTSSSDTCPDSCPLKGGACYARGGPLGIHWRAVDRGRGSAWSRFLDRIRALDPGQLWRHNQAGDLPGKGNRIAPRALQDLVTANRGRNGFTYTHKPVLSGPHRLENRRAIHSANRNGLAVNLSANTLAEADRLAELDIGPVVALLPQDAERLNWTPEGRKVVTCPAQIRDDITCESCRLCARIDRTAIVGFRAHGSSARKAERIARGEW